MCAPSPEAWVIGGAQIYAEALPLAQRAVITEIAKDFEGDAHAPAFDAKSWRETARSTHLSSSGLPYSFVTLETGLTRTPRHDRAIQSFARGTTARRNRHAGSGSEGQGGRHHRRQRRPGPRRCGRLAAEGAKVAIAARRPDHLARAAEEIRAATGAEVLALPTDVRVAGDCERLAQAVLAAGGRVDILLNNAGTSSAGSLADADDAVWQADWDLKVMGAVRMMRLLLPQMRQQRDGRIVNITTVSGKAPRPRGLPTSVTRAAGINLTKSVAGEVAADNVRVNTICIGLVRTAQIDRAAKGGDLEAHYAALARERVPLGRVASAAEFADLFAFLVSDRASYITGTAINFDGRLGHDGLKLSA